MLCWSPPSALGLATSLPGAWLGAHTRGTRPSGLGSGSGNGATLLGGPAPHPVSSGRHRGNGAAQGAVCGSTPTVFKQEDRMRKGKRRTAAGAHGAGCGHRGPRGLISFSGNWLGGGTEPTTKGVAAERGRGCRASGHPDPDSVCGRQRASRAGPPPAALQGPTPGAAAPATTASRSLRPARARLLSLQSLKETHRDVLTLAGVRPGRWGGQGPAAGGKAAAGPVGM